jgi:hypothetical protein
VLFASPLFAQNDDAALNIAEPDFTLVNLPTSLRLPSMKSAFRVTHRFVRPLKCGECEDNLLEDLFGIDNGAAIGLEFRFGIVPDKPDTMFGSYAIEKRAGGHVFQLNFSDYFGTTMRQLAQGAPDGDHWYMGFNISRKFF